MGLECRLEVAGERWIRVVDVLNAEKALHLGDAVFGRRDGLLLEVDEVVAALLVALRTGGQARHQPGEEEVLVRRFLGLAADDERRPRLVDEDVVDLVDDGEVALALNALVQFRDHVVAEIVEPEFVVGAVGYVGRIRLPPRNRSQVDQALVGGRVAGLEDVCLALSAAGAAADDDPHRQSQEVVDRPHPLSVATGQIVVDRNDVNAATGKAVESDRERGDEGLALAGLHLGDLALVQDDAAHELDVEMAHPQRAQHGFTRGGEDLRQDLVHRLLEATMLALAAVAGDLAAALELGVVALVLGGLFGLAGVADLLAQLLDDSAQLRVGTRLHLRLQLVDPIHEGFDPPELPVI